MYVRMGRSRDATRSHIGRIGRVGGITVLACRRWRPSQQPAGSRPCWLGRALMVAVRSRRMASAAPPPFVAQARRPRREAGEPDMIVRSGSATPALGQKCVAGPAALLPVFPDPHDLLLQPLIPLLAARRLPLALLRRVICRGREFQDRARRLAPERRGAVVRKPAPPRRAGPRRVPGHQRTRMACTPARAPRLGHRTRCALIQASPTMMAMSPIHTIPRLPTWHDGRMIIIGDAAHALSPTSGQGGSLFHRRRCRAGQMPTRPAQSAPITELDAAWAIEKAAAAVSGVKALLAGAAPERFA